MTNDLKAQIGLINNRLSELSYGENPNELYEPIRYIMSLGGKRLRPVLVLLAYRLFKDDPESILDQALAVEVFHNFTLMHDDIMDEAPLRRGKPTVHEKWNSSTAILSGDVMLVKAYDLLLDAPTDLKAIITAFNACAAGVCEGQQFDMNFETLNTVSEADYIHMIKLKTAVLLGFSLKLGAMLAGADEQACEKLYDFGVHIGIGFQLKDDLLDVYADQEKFGKQVGGDIIANKKTFLLLKALELSNDEQKSELENWISATEFNSDEKVREVTRVYDEMGIRQLTLDKMNEYFNKGFEALNDIPVEEGKKRPLISFAEYLIDRDK
ncbi:polyprenyl synthetase family protein [Roseivirga sp.]|uniref:polyprenyl synthetase family protein n=1 Tax=Roseivirga sp. TaxID=1964215 RepID=UPI003B527BC1